MQWFICAELEGRDGKYDLADPKRDIRIVPQFTAKLHKEEPQESAVALQLFLALGSRTLLPACGQDSATTNATKKAKGR